MSNETSRIEFLENRDGVDGALDFCRRTINAYRKAVLQTQRRGHNKSHFASSVSFKRSFVESYLEMKRYLHKHGKLMM